MKKLNIALCIVISACTARAADGGENKLDGEKRLEKLSRPREYKEKPTLITPVYHRPYLPIMEESYSTFGPAVSYTTSFKPSAQADIQRIMALQVLSGNEILDVTLIPLSQTVREFVEKINKDQNNKDLQ